MSAKRSPSFAITLPDYGSALEAADQCRAAAKSLMLVTSLLHTMEGATDKDAEGAVDDHVYADASYSACQLLELADGAHLPALVRLRPVSSVDTLQRDSEFPPQGT